MGWNLLSQIGFGTGLALQTEFRAARTSLGAYVRLLSIRSQGWLRAFIPAAERRTSFTSSPIKSGAKTYFTLGLTLGKMGLEELPLRDKKFESIFWGEK